MRLNTVGQLGLECYLIFELSIKSVKKHIFAHDGKKIVSASGIWGPSPLPPHTLLLPWFSFHWWLSVHWHSTRRSSCLLIIARRCLICVPFISFMNRNIGHSLEWLEINAVFPWVPATTVLVHRCCAVVFSCYHDHADVSGQCVRMLWRNVGAVLAVMEYFRGPERYLLPLRPHRAQHAVSQTYAQAARQETAMLSKSKRCFENLKHGSVCWCACFSVCLSVCLSVYTKSEKKTAGL